MGKRNKFEEAETCNNTTANNEQALTQVLSALAEEQGEMRKQLEELQSSFELLSEAQAKLPQSDQMDKIWQDLQKLNEAVVALASAKIEQYKPQRKPFSLSAWLKQKKDQMLEKLIGFLQKGVTK